uniref:Uncharacterized protein n=1 Tax=Anas platyrhynchos TaxID=8839 RepID=A0A8B9TEG4_ANAPL
HIPAVLIFQGLALLLLQKVNYAVAIPSQLYHPFSETVCLQLSRKQAAPIHVTVTLQSKAGNATLITQTISQLVFFHCTSFQVPPPVGQPEEVAFIEITALGADSEVQKKQKVLIKHAEKKTLIQTDKPVYKPGQIGMVIIAMGCLHVFWISV